MMITIVMTRMCVVVQQILTVACSSEIAAAVTADAIIALDIRIGNKKCDRE